MNENFIEKSICREGDELNSVPEILRRSGDLRIQSYKKKNKLKYSETRSIGIIFISEFNITLNNY